MKKSTGPTQRISKSTNVKSHQRQFHQHRNHDKERNGDYSVTSFAKDIIDDGIYRRVEKTMKDGNVIEIRESQYFTQGSIGLKPMSRSEYMSRKNLMRNRKSHHMYKLNLKIGRSHHSPQDRPDDATVVPIESKPTPPLDVMNMNMNWTDDPLLTDTLLPLDTGFEGLYFPSHHTEEGDLDQDQNLLHLIYDEFNSPIDEYRRCSIMRPTSNQVIPMA